MRKSAHFSRFGRREMAFTVPIPKLEPSREVPGFEAQGEMRDRHLAGVIGRPARRASPESGDLGNMLGPVLDPCVKDRADDMVLPNVGVKMPQECAQLFHSTDSFEERRCHSSKMSPD